MSFYSISLTNTTHYGIVADTTLSGGHAALSVSLWFKGTSLSGRQLIGTTSAATSDGGWAIYTDDANGQIEFYLSKPANAGALNRTTNNTSLYNGNWHSIVVSYNGTRTGTHIYYDGVEQTYVNDTGPDVGSNFASSVKLSAGDSTGFEGTQLGKYAYPAVFYSALTAGNAATIAAGANFAGAQAQWLFTEGTGTTAADSSGNGHTLTFNTIDAWSSDVPFGNGVSAKVKASTNLIF